MNRQEELACKCELLGAYMAERSLSGVFLSKPQNFAWLGCGACNIVSITSPAGVATLGYADGQLHLITKNIEERRMLEEELEGLGDVRTHTAKWHEFGQGEEFISRMLAGGRGASDTGVGGTQLLGEDFDALRYSLTEAELDRYRALGKSCCDAVEATCRNARPGMRECEIAAELYSRCKGALIDPLVCLVAADERILSYRHPIVTDKTLDKHLLVALCGQRWGLVTAITRIVYFGELPDDLRCRHEACARVDAALISATRPGARFCDALAAGVKTYEETGFGDEWNLHHQGGPTGYAPREFIVTPGEERTIRVNQPVAWNPSITGTKSEDTIVAREGEAEFVTLGGEWPALEIELDGAVFRRPEILCL